MDLHLADGFSHELREGLSAASPPVRAVATAGSVPTDVRRPLADRLLLERCTPAELRAAVDALASETTDERQPRAPPVAWVWYDRSRRRLPHRQETGEVTMRNPTLSFAAVIVGGLLFAAGTAMSSVWMMALGLVLLPLGVVQGLRG